MSPSTDTSDCPQPSLAEAHTLSALCSHASVDVFNLYRTRMAQPDGTGEDPRWPAVRKRLRQLAFHLLDAAGWPEGGWDDDDAAALAFSGWEDPDRVSE